MTFLIVNFIVLLALRSQQYDNVWLMGYNYDQSDDFIEGVYLSFTDGILIVDTQNLVLDLQSSSISMSNRQGDLQFYTNGCRVVNWQNELVENGNEINPGEIYNNYCIDDIEPWREYYPGGKQSVLTLPLPGIDSIYYLFHKAIEIVEDPNQGLLGLTRPMYYTIVDMRLNDGSGRVTEKNVILLEQDMYFGQLTAVKHANGQDWWVITPAQEGTNGYYRFLFTGGGVSDVMYQEEGMPGVQDGGWANFSPDGRYFARYSPINDDIFLFDFDRQTGELSNFQQILIEEEEEWVGGVAFSPSSRFMYVSSYDFIYQFDTWADDIAASRITVAVYEYQGEFLEDNFWGMQLGPDCRLYVFCNSCDVIHVIHNPDEPGLACNFEQGAVELPWPIFRSQPHFPNYRLGPVGNEGLPCTPVVSVEETIIPQTELRVFPNPATQQITLTPMQISGQWVLYDGFGRVVAQAKLQLATNAQVDISSLSSGLYFWRVLGTELSGKVVKE
jgi:hypothetical protein